MTVARAMLEQRPQFQASNGRFLGKMYPKDREFRWVAVHRVLTNRITEFIRGERHVVVNGCASRSFIRASGSPPRSMA
jgi:hypothetical protein